MWHYKRLHIISKFLSYNTALKNQHGMPAQWVQWMPQLHHTLAWPGKLSKLFCIPDCISCLPRHVHKNTVQLRSSLDDADTISGILVCPDRRYFHFRCIFPLKSYLKAKQTMSLIPFLLFFSHFFHFQWNSVENIPKRRDLCACKTWHFLAIL